MSPGFASGERRSLPRVAPPVVVGTAEPDDGAAWLEALTGDGPDRDQALEDLHGLMLRAARHQVRRMHGMLAGAGPGTLEDLANAAADGALAVLLRKLDTFEGRSRFTTWAYKFAILEAATEVRRHAWAGRAVVLLQDDHWADTAPGPAEVAEARDLADAVRAAMGRLTAHQRRVAVALLVDDVPVDVLAERLGTTRGALYKTLHDARGRLRSHLTADGYLAPPTAEEGAR